MELSTARATAQHRGLDLTRDRRPPRMRRPQTFRVTHADETGRTTMPRGTLGTLRDARARLREVARAVPHDELEAAITTFVELAWDAGFSRMATCSIVAAALEEGLPRRRGQPVSVAAAAWERRARAIYDAIVRRSA